jgi:hypothetical protein
MHFIEIAGVDAPDRRSLLVERALREGLSVRDLRAVIRAARMREPNHRRTRSTIRRALLASRAILTVVRPVDRLLAEVREKPATPKLESQMTLLVANYKNLSEACLASAGALETELVRIRRTSDERGDGEQSLRAG